MHKTVFKLPRLGGNESEARILAWKKAPGEAFAADETLLEVETDKAVVEVPAPAAGVMGRPLKQADDYAAFDEALAEVELEGGEVFAQAEAGEAPAVTAAVPQALEPVPVAVPARAGERVRASPAARRAARDAGLDLAAVAGSGPAGRIVLRDLPAAAAGTTAGPAAQTVFRGAHGELQLRRWNAAAAATLPTVVLIHGLYGDADTWAGIAKVLADAGLPVLAPDLPLHGGSAAGAARFADLADALQEMLDTLVPGPRLLVGHSLGGALALKLAQAPGGQKPHALALIAPAGLGTEIDQGFVDGMLHASEPALLRRELDKLTHRPQPFGAAWLGELHARLRGRAAALEALVGTFARRGTQQIDLRPALDALVTQGVPISVMWGRRDQVLPWPQALALPPQVALHLFAEAGHMPQVEQGSVVAGLLLRLAAARA